MRLDVRPILSVTRGAASAPIAQYTADAYNVSGAQWNTAMPSDTSILDRYVEVGADINVTWNVTCTSGTQTQPIMQYGVDFALASRPFARMCTKTEIAVNGTAISFNGALVDALQALEQADDTDAVEYPSLNAVYASNSDARQTQADVIAAAGGTQAARYNALAASFKGFIDPTSATGTILSGSASYGTGANAVTCVGGVPQIPAIPTGGGGWTNQVVTIGACFHIAEPLFHPLLLARACESAACMSQVRTLNVSCNFGSPASMVAMLSRGTSVTAVTQPQFFSAKVFANPPELRMRRLTPPMSLASIAAPSKCITPYADTRIYLPQPVRAVKNSGQITSNTATLPCMPSKLLIWARVVQSDATKAPFQLLPITGLNVRIGNSESLFTSYDQVELFRLSKRGGLSDSISFEQFCGKAYKAGAAVQLSGAPIVISAADLCLGEGLAGNVGGSFSLSVQATVSDPMATNVDINVELGVLALSDSVLVSSAGVSVQGNNLTSEREVLALTSEPEGAIVASHARELVGGALAGGSFFSKLRGLVDFGKKAYQSIQDNKLAIQAASSALAQQKWLPGVASAAESWKENTGYGLGHGEAGAGSSRRRKIADRLGM